MKLLNTSTVQTSALWPLVEFVVKRCQTPYMAHLVVKDSVEPLLYAAGLAWKRAGNDVTAPSRVEVTLAGFHYPKRTVHRKSCGVVSVYSWQEEFVHVLAHELRHIDQFWSTNPPRHYEVDAERFAIEVLEEFRASRCRRLTA